MPTPAKRVARKATASKTAASTRARARKAPTDRKAPAKQLAAELRKGDYVFEHDGEAYYLPNAKSYATHVDGGFMMDMLLSDEDDEATSAKLAFRIFGDAKGDIDPDAWTAARSKPFDEFAELVLGWLSAAGVDLGK